MREIEGSERAAYSSESQASENLVDVVVRDDRRTSRSVKGGREET